MRKIWPWLCICLLVLAPWVGARDLQKGDTGSDVRELQEMLIQVGYLAREADGEFGSTTEKALRLFQRDQGLVVTGVAKSGDVKKLQSAKAGREGGGVLFAPGNLGEPVIDLQKVLIKAGYLKDRPDGVYGAATTKAVQRFQRDHKLEVIGAIDEDTWALLAEQRESVSRRLKKDERRTKRQVVKSVKANKSVKKVQSKKASKSVKKAHRDLALGDKGDEVLEVQRLLIRNGYNPGVVDGRFGPATERALKAWQKAHGVTVTGVADEFFLAEAGGDIEAPRKYLKKWVMEASAYTSQDGDTTNHTARGSVLSRGHVAVDPDIIPLGSLVYVEGYGYAVADDIGGAIRHHKIDVAMDTLDDAYQWGRRKVTVYLVEKTK